MRVALVVPEDLVEPVVRAALVVPEDLVEPAVRAALVVPEDLGEPAVRRWCWKARRRRRRWCEAIHAPGWR